MIWSRFPFIRFGKNHLAKHSERGKKTNLEFGKSQRAVENREKWRKVVAKSFMVPQRPSRLRDR